MTPTGTEGLRGVACAIAAGLPVEPIEGWSTTEIRGADGGTQGVVLVPEEPHRRADVEAVLGRLRETVRTPGPKAVVGDVDPGDTDAICRVDVELEGDDVLTITLTRDARL